MPDLGTSTAPLQIPTQGAARSDGRIGFALCFSPARPGGAMASASSRPTFLFDGKGNALPLDEPFPSAIARPWVLPGSRLLGTIHEASCHSCGAAVGGVLHLYANGSDFGDQGRRVPLWIVCRIDPDDNLHRSWAFASHRDADAALTKSTLAWTFKCEEGWCGIDLRGEHADFAVMPTAHA